LRLYGQYRRIRSGGIFHRDHCDTERKPKHRKQAGFHGIRRDAIGAASRHRVGAKRICALSMRHS
jgi:hypothetical protein